MNVTQLRGGSTLTFNVNPLKQFEPFTADSFHISYYLVLFAWSPCVLHMSGYTRETLDKRIRTESTFGPAVCLAGNICFTLNMNLLMRHSTSCNWVLHLPESKNYSNKIYFHFARLSPDFRLRWRTSSGQHADKHPQFPSQPPADTEPHHASVWSHGDSTE